MKRLRLVFLIAATAALFSCGSRHKANNAEEPTHAQPPATNAPKPSDPASGEPTKPAPQNPVSGSAEVLYDDVLRPDDSKSFNLNGGDELFSLNLKMVPGAFFLETEGEKDWRCIVKTGPVSVDYEAKKVFYDKGEGKFQIGQIFYTIVKGQWEYLVHPCDFYTCEIRAKITRDIDKNMSCNIRMIDTKDNSVMVEGSATQTRATNP